MSGATGADLICRYGRFPPADHSAFETFFFPELDRLISRMRKIDVKWMGHAGALDMKHVAQDCTHPTTSELGAGNPGQLRITGID